jgi:hypothetical protein
MRERSADKVREGNAGILTPFRSAVNQHEFGLLRTCSAKLPAAPEDGGAAVSSGTADIHPDHFAVPTIQNECPHGNALVKALDYRAHVGNNCRCRTSVVVAALRRFSDHSISSRFANQHAIGHALAADSETHAAVIVSAESNLFPT